MNSIIEKLIKRKKVMIDTNIVIFFLEGNEVFGDISKEIFFAVEKGKVKGFISVITVAEILVKPMKHCNSLLIDRIKKFLHTFPNLFLVDVNKTIALEAAKIRGKTGLRMPDALIISSAKISGCAIVGADNQWENKDLGLEFYNIGQG